MKNVTFLGSKKIGWQCLEFLYDNRSELDINLVQLGTNLSKKDIYRDKFVQLSQLEGISIFSQPDDILLETDIIISVQFHHILSPAQLAKASLAAYNLHMAPLPEYRGCNQFSMAILDGASTFGTTLHIMDTGIDHGDIVAELRFDIPNDIWVHELYEKTEEASFKLFKHTLSNLIKGDVSTTPQSSLIPSRGTSIHYRNEIQKIKHLQLDWSEEKIMRHIRATYMPGFEPPYFTLNGRKIYTTPDHE